MSEDQSEPMNVRMPGRPKKRSMKRFRVSTSNG